VLVTILPLYILVDESSYHTSIRKPDGLSHCERGGIEKHEALAGVAVFQLRVTCT